MKSFFEKSDGKWVFFSSDVEPTIKVFIKINLPQKFNHQLNLEKIEKMALLGKNVKEQTKYAYDEIKKQIEQICQKNLVVEVPLDTCQVISKTMEEMEKIKKYVRIIKYVETLNANTGGEQGHRQADNTLCELLKELGYGEVVEAYENISDMWYA